MFGGGQAASFWGGATAPLPRHRTATGSNNNTNH